MIFEELPLNDLGNAPRMYVTGLANIVPMGPVAMFTFYLLRPQDRCRVVELELIAPIECVGPAIDLAVTTLGARTLVNASGQWLGQTMRRMLM